MTQKFSPDFFICHLQIRIISRNIVKYTFLYKYLIRLKRNVGFMTKNTQASQNTLKTIFTDDVIAHLKSNKNLITMDLLDELRSFGNEGKHIALEILDIDKDEEQYYLDAFGNRIAFLGNRRLKKAFTKLPLSKIHKEEIARCAEDIHYFKDNYIKIRTKAGVNFPDLREYQNDFIDSILPDENEDNIGLMGRQSGKSISTGIYLAHKYNFGKELNIGIVANKGPMAREFLANVKNMLIELPIWMQQGSTVWNKGSIENESKMRILTDVPSQDSFRGFTIAILVVDECAFIRPNIWDEFSDSIFPSQSGLAWKKNIILSTANGMNHFYQMVKGARDGSNGMNIFEVNWKDVPRFSPDGNRMETDVFMDKIIKKHGIVYFNQNYANEFMGSSHTLISSDKLATFEKGEVHEKRDGKLKIYHYPEKGHNYVMTVDPAKDGTDAFAVQIVDITDFHFKQVATAQLQIDYLLMPEFLFEWAEFYNKPYMIIENNEGAGQSIADQMMNDYEYENLHFDKDTGRNRKKKYPGFRTTTKSRKQILQTLKLFIENDKLEINDNATISEFYQFILINNKYQADEGSHDDMIMSLALVFVPFINSKNFEDMRLLVKNLYNDDIDDEEKVDFSEMLTIGNFDDGSEESDYFENSHETWGGFTVEDGGSFI